MFDDTDRSLKKKRKLSKSKGVHTVTTLATLSKVIQTSHTFHLHNRQQKNILAESFVLTVGVQELYNRVNHPRM